MDTIITNVCTNRMSTFAAVFVLSLIALILTACQNEESTLDYCDALSVRASDVGVQLYLTGWVDQHVLDRSIDREDTTYSTGVWPSGFVYKRHVNWPMLGIDDTSLVLLPEVRLIGARPSVEDGTKIEPSNTVYFGSRSGLGYLVKLSSEAALDVDEEYVAEVNNRVSVLCRERD